MALALPSGSPLTLPPPYARDAHELQSVLEAQQTEAAALRARLAEVQRECAQLKTRVRDSEGELSAATEATISAAQKLEEHAGRQGLVLAAGVERTNAERATIEHELQRMERLLAERDQEISRLRAVARELESTRLQGELELTGLVAVHEATSTEVRTLGEDVARLRHQLYNGKGHAAAQIATGPSPGVATRTEETAALLKAKREEHASLQRQAEAVAAEARRLEAEGVISGNRLREYERALRERQRQLDMRDQRLVREAATLREHCEDLRSVLRGEQRNAVEADQRAFLRERCGEEADGIRRELTASLSTIKRLVTALRESGRSVSSPELPGDPIDTHLHGYLRAGASMGNALPPLVWRIAPGVYLIGEERVTLLPAGPELLVSDAAGVTPPQPLSDFVHRQAQLAAASVRALI